MLLNFSWHIIRIVAWGYKRNHITCRAILLVLLLVRTITTWEGPLQCWLNSDSNLIKSWRYQCKLKYQLSFFLASSDWISWDLKLRRNFPTQSHRGAFKGEKREGGVFKFKLLIYLYCNVLNFVVRQCVYSHQQKWNNPKKMWEPVGKCINIWVHNPFPKLPSQVNWFICKKKI